MWPRTRSQHSRGRPRACPCRRARRRTRALVFLSCRAISRASWRTSKWGSRFATASACVPSRLRGGSPPSRSSVGCVPLALRDKFSHATALASPPLPIDKSGASPQEGDACESEPAGTQSATVSSEPLRQTCGVWKSESVQQKRGDSACHKVLTSKHQRQASVISRAARLNEAAYPWRR